jgi:hypothetical protein
LTEIPSRTRARKTAGLSIPDQVLIFLATNDDQAFKAREIASQIGVDEDGRAYRDTGDGLASWWYTR